MSFSTTLRKSQRQSYDYYVVKTITGPKLKYQGAGIKTSEVSIASDKIEDMGSGVELNVSAFSGTPYVVSTIRSES
jgi:hypothetical protein